MLDKHHTESPVPQLATEQQQQHREVQTETATTKAVSDWVNKYGFKPGEFDPQLKAQMQERKAERKRLNQ